MLWVRSRSLSISLYRLLSLVLSLFPRHRDLLQPTNYAHPPLLQNFGDDGFGAQRHNGRYGLVEPVPILARTPSTAESRICFAPRAVCTPQLVYCPPGTTA